MAKFKLKVSSNKTWEADGKTTATIDLPSNLPLSVSEKAKLKKKIGELLVTETLEHLAKAKSPIAGEGKFKKLNKEYKKFKEKKGRGGKANLEFLGNLTNEFRPKNTTKGIELGNFKRSEAGKAEGHNNFEGGSKLPKRRYIPGKGQSYNADISEKIDNIIGEAIGSARKPKKTERDLLLNADTKSEFFLFAEEIFPGLSRAQIAETMLANEEWTAFLLDAELLSFLK